MSSLLFGNGTNIVHWRSNPRNRGTFDILSVCSITMLLCVWTAVHLNVPPPGSGWKPMLRKVGWLVLTLLAPEKVAYTSWSQRQNALSLMLEVNEAYGVPNSYPGTKRTVDRLAKAISYSRKVFLRSGKELERQPNLESQASSSGQARYTWTLTHGFYAAMGGIAFKIPKSFPLTIPNSSCRIEKIVFLTDDGIRLLMKQESSRSLIPDLSDEEIKSKSKANGIAKSLVCVQAVWFIAQCITRLAQHIPISLLELNTFCHAVCALLIYLFWWEKPFEVDYPTIIEGQVLWELYAFEWMQSNQSPAIERYCRELKACLASDEWFQTLPNAEQQIILEQLQLLDESELLVITNPDNGRASGDYENPNQGQRLSEHNEVPSTILMPGKFLEGTGIKAPDWKDLAERYGLLESFERYTGSHRPCPHIHLTAEDVIRYKMAWRAIKYRRQLNPDQPENIYGSMLFAHRCKDWPDTGDLPFPIAFGLSLAALIYGGLHALAWCVSFESSTKQLMWRISACTVMAGMPVIMTVIAAIGYLRNYLVVHRINIVVPIRQFVDGLLVLAYMLVLPYMLARAYLVVECFINLSHLPAEVYDVPSWSAYFPHIS